MEYNDEKLLSISEYEIMAKAYSQKLKEKGFFFVQIDGRENNELIAECYKLLLKLKSSLFFLGNFLGTGRMYALNERHIKLFQTLFPECDNVERYKIRGDKTKCFLNMLSLESQLLIKLVDLSQNSPFSSQIDRMLNERLRLSSEIYKIKGLIN